MTHFGVINGCLFCDQKKVKQSTTLGVFAASAASKGQITASSLVRIALGLQRGGIIESAFRERLEGVTERRKYWCASRGSSRARSSAVLPSLLRADGSAQYANKTADVIALIA